MAGTEDSAHGVILLVEDDSAVARLTELVLAGAGYTVVLARQHSAAHEAIAQTKFDLILADTEKGARAPDLSGLSELALAAGCPVLLFSAHHFPQEQISNAGLAGVVPKPFDVDDLVSVVRQTLADPASRRPGWGPANAR